MRRGIWCVILIVLLVISVFSSCKPSTNVADKKSNDAYEFLIQYFEHMMNDPSQASQVCYFENESAKESFLEGMQMHPLDSYEIIQFDKLLDYLWVAELHAVDNMHPSGVYFVNYIGIIDNNMLVYRNKKSLPTKLTEGLEIDDYNPHGPDIV